MRYSQDNKKVFLLGMQDGLPIGFGYLAVSFSLGIAARKVGLTPLQGFLASFLTNASAMSMLQWLHILELTGISSRWLPYVATLLRPPIPISAPALTSLLQAEIPIITVRKAASCRH